MNTTTNNTATKSYTLIVTRDANGKVIKTERRAARKQELVRCGWEKRPTLR